MMRSGDTVELGRVRDTDLTVLPFETQTAHRLELTMQIAAVEIAYVIRCNSACIPTDLVQRAILSLQQCF